jgi:hypothetical protein
MGTQPLQFKNDAWNHRKQTNGFLHHSEKTTLTFVISLPIKQNQAIYIICFTKDETLTMF